MCSKLNGGYTGFDCRGLDLLSSVGVSLPELFESILRCEKIGKTLFLVNAVVGGEKSSGIPAVVTGKDASGNYTILGGFTVAKSGGTVYGPGPAITSQSGDYSGDYNSDLKLSVVATGTKLSYQWQVSTDGGTTWVNGTTGSAKTDTLTVKFDASRDGYKYRCQVTDLYGESVTSNTITLTYVAPNT